MPKKLYVLNPGDKEIFEKTKQNPNYFTDFYLRTDTTGTWWLPGAETDHWKTGYDRLARFWRSIDKPEEFIYHGKTYRTTWSHSMSGNFPDHPAFFNNHGMLFLPYHEKLHQMRIPFITLIGGFGSGKTMGVAMSMLVSAATLPMYRGFGLAPYSMQSMEMYRLMMDMIAGTEFEKRFLIAAPKSPVAQIILGNDYTGQTSIEFYPILNNVEKIRTLTGDEAAIDQAEKLDGGGELEEVVRSVGTRFRGRVSRGGRERLGRMIFIANAADNQELWDLYDKAEEDPKNYYSISPSSYDNIWLTDADIRRFELQVGESQESRDQFLFGKRPLGNGEIFSRQIIENMRDKSLDDHMAICMESGGDCIHLTTRGVGTYEWLLPRYEGHQYLVVSDPGTKNPPHRDSAVIMIWNITAFPGDTTGIGEEIYPATLAGFVWVYGNGSIDTWATRYKEMVDRYQATFTNAFDATGFQSGYDTWLPILKGVYPEKINLSGNNKFATLNAAKVLLSEGMIKTPHAVSMLYAQMAKYVLPEPQKLRQDLVITLAMSAWWLQRMYFFDRSDWEIPDEAKQTSRWHRAPTSRYRSRKAR